MLKFILTLIVLKACCVDSFVPKQIIDTLVSIVDEKTKLEFGQVSESLSHEEILRRGLIKSVAKFMQDQKNGQGVDLRNMAKYFNSTRSLFSDYYKKKCLLVALDVLLETEFYKNVADVDFDAATKDMPYAHFDAETFHQSNQRVINLTSIVNASIWKSDYKTARKIAAQVLHTIQDFYSHSNWVEIGNLNTINTAIGTKQMDSLPIVSPNDTNTCSNNCTLVPIVSNQLMVYFLESINETITKFFYYKCPNNSVIVTKLVSGYYVNQKLADGTPVLKPLNKMKCSHGGILDDTSFESANGGINKDSGFYLLSPHAPLHTIAANLAINHTEYFFNQMRANVGDTSFNSWLQITHNNVCI